MSKRRKILLDNVEVTIANEDRTEILEYIDEDGQNYIQENHPTGMDQVQQFMIGDGTIVQYLTPEEYSQDEPGELDGDENHPAEYTIVDEESEDNHPEDSKSHLKLFNNSKENADNFNDVFEEECAKQGSADDVLILKRFKNDFKILVDIVGKGEDPSLEDESRVYNNFEQADFLVIDGLKIGLQVVFSSGHIYVDVNTKKCRCYLYPKCTGSGSIVSEGETSYFQLYTSHSLHGFQDFGLDVLLLLVAIKKRVKNNLDNFEEIFIDEIQRPCYRTDLKERISLENIVYFMNCWNSFLGDSTVDIVDGDKDLNVAKPYSLIDVGNGCHVLYSDDQLYNRNTRAGDYKCRLYQSGCPALGVRFPETFTLTRSHVGHGNQTKEHVRLKFMSILREQASSTKIPLQQIFQQVCKSDPMFHKISQTLPYHAMYKIMKRARTQGASLKLRDTKPRNPSKFVRLKSVTATAEKADKLKKRTSPAKFPCMEYTLMEGERLGSCILYSNEQLYTLNRNNYYRCRMYPQGCQATGMREENHFRLCRGHSAHGTQEPERRRIVLINSIKKKTMTNPDPDYFESVFNQECEKPEYADIVDRVSFTVVLNNMRKIWKRYQLNDPTLSVNILRNDMEQEDLHRKMIVREYREKDPLEQDELEESVRMAVEIGDDISCESNLNPSEYTLMEGERLGSCLLYSNQQLYTYNQRNYYRCRMYPIGCRATGIIKDSLFYLLKKHNSHGSQEREVRRLVLISKIKRRAQIDPSRLQTIFSEECSKEEFADVAEMVNFKKIHSTLDRCRRRAASDVLEVIEPTIPPGVPSIEKEKPTPKWNQFTENPADAPGDETIQYFVGDNTGILSQAENQTESFEISQNQNNSPESQEITEQVLMSELNLNHNEENELQEENVDPNTEKIDESNYEMIGGDRFGSKLLYFEGHLYNANRDNYYRCRMYSSCIATGRISGNQFQLLRGHSEHGLQEDERERLIFINKLKRRVQEELDLPIKFIFDDECKKSDNPAATSMLNYKALFSTLVKCRSKAQIKDLADDQNSLSELNNLLDNVRPAETEKSNELAPNWNLDECSASETEEVVEVPKAELNVPTKYQLIQGDRQGSLILYANGHLYTKNRGTYYRCRLHPTCYGSGSRRGNLFYMARQHTNHPLQDDEKCRLALMSAIKHRVCHETTPLKVIYDEEILKPEYASISDLVSFKMIQSTMIKIRERVKYAQEVGTVVVPNESLLWEAGLNQADENEALDEAEDVDHPESDSEDVTQTTKDIEDDDRSTYYYILDYEGAEEEEEQTNLRLSNYITRDYYSIPTDEESLNTSATNAIAVYTLDIDEMEALRPRFNRKVHLPDDELQPITKSSDIRLTSHIPSTYTLIEDCINEKVLLYSNKQLYTKKIYNKKENVYSCRISLCNAVGEIKNNLFHLVHEHSYHSPQNKIKLQLQLIARIKTRCMERRTARVSKIFREECLKPEFRSVANTITLDGISEMVRKYRKKLYPTKSIQSEDIPPLVGVGDLPPPAEFSMINGSTPEIKLLYSRGALFYHAGKGVYHCHENNCSAYGRRDRIFFQLLASHTEHAPVELDDRFKLLQLISKIEDQVLRRKPYDETTNNIAEKEAEPMEIDQIETSAEGVAVSNAESSANSQSSTKSILQQAWEELQVHI